MGTSDIPSRSARPLPIVLGALAGLFAFGLLVAGGALLWADETQRDVDGFFTSPAYELATDGYAVTTEDIDLGADRGDWFPARGDLTFRVEATVATPGDAVFLGIAPTEDVDTYLDGVAHARIAHVGDDPDEVEYGREGGSARPAPPADQDFWTATAVGPGSQTLTWDAERGNWTLVMMNADASVGFVGVATAGARLDLLVPIGIGLLVAGFLAAAVAALLIITGLSGAAGSSAAQRLSPAEPAAYPVTLEAELDPGLSRWLWLVKWLLAIPHFVVLAFLWLAFALLTVVAGVAILFTGRYPAGIFAFNVGVLRWTWRVTYYTYGALGTDRYPPFTLSADPDYPTAFDVAYPQELSRGLVLVKWWLLAIPHYLIVGLLTGGAASWAFDSGPAEGVQVAFGGGLIGLLVLVAAVILAVTGRYPQGLFDLIVGLQRWVYRVIAYVALMTDEYPPFRLDAGGHEPAAPPPPPPSGTRAGEEPELVRA